MRIITKEPLLAFVRKHPGAKTALQDWIIRVEKANWSTFADIKSDFRSVDAVGNQHYVFNIKGNDYRLVVVIKFFNHTILIRFIGTHSEYDRIKDCSMI